jgi:hypothetical protein
MLIRRESSDKQKFSEQSPASGWDWEWKEVRKFYLSQGNHKYSFLNIPGERGMQKPHIFFKI